MRNGSFAMVERLEQGTCIVKSSAVCGIWGHAKIGFVPGQQMLPATSPSQTASEVKVQSMLPYASYAIITINSITCIISISTIVLYYY